MSEDWNPGFYRLVKNTLFFEFVPYEKKWYCNEHKMIHQSQKEKNNCKYCKDK